MTAMYTGCRWNRAFQKNKKSKKEGIVLEALRIIVTFLNLAFAVLIWCFLRNERNKAARHGFAFMILLSLANAWLLIV